MEWASEVKVFDNGFVEFSIFTKFSNVINTNNFGLYNNTAGY